MKLTKKIINFLKLRIKDKFFALENKELINSFLNSIKYEKNEVISLESIGEFYFFMINYYGLFDSIMDEIYLFCNKGIIEFCNDLETVSSLNVNVKNKILSEIKYNDKEEITYESYKQAYDTIIANKSNIKFLGMALGLMRKKIDNLLGIEEF